MSGRIRDEDVAYIRDRAPIDEIVGEYVQLKSAGGGQKKGLCPFHDEKSPSFHVTPSKGYFHCFGCQTGGDVIAFLMKIDHLTFTETIERLADRMGYTLRYDEGGPSTPAFSAGARSRLIAANTEAARFYQEQLNTSPDAAHGRDLLTKRGFDKDACMKFGVGFAPDEWDALTKHLRAKGYSIDELETAGLSKMGQRGPIDRFRNRLTWPIRDISGDVVGFGCRKLASDEEDQGPKYLNTPETPVYKKSQVLYGLDAAKKEIAKKRQAVIVEGYTDVMAAQLAGITTAVATCGTAFGADHIRILRRFELRQQKGDLALRDLIARRVPLFEFAIRAELAHHKLDSAEGRVNALNAAAPLVAQIRDKSLRPEYTRLLAGWLGTEVEIVSKAVAQGVKSQPKVSESIEPTTEENSNWRPDPNEARLILEREVLKARLQEASLFTGTLWSDIEPGAFTHPAYKELRKTIDETPTLSAETISDERIKTLFTELTVEPIRADGKPSAAYVESIVARLREVAISRSIAELKSSLQRLNPVENEIEYNAAFAQLVALENARRNLHDLALGGL